MRRRRRAIGPQPIEYPLTPVHCMQHYRPPGPPFPGVYFLIVGGEVVYVGQSTCVSERVRDHIQRGRTFDAVAALRAPLWRLEMMEVAYIRWLRPKDNTCLNTQPEFLHPSTFDGNVVEICEQ